MEHECKQESIIQFLRDRAESNVNRLVEMEKRQIAIGADVSHIKGRIDNGLSGTVTDMHKNLTMLIPVIDRHTALEKRLEDFFWASVKAVVWSLGIAGVSLMIWGLLNGWKP